MRLGDEMIVIVIPLVLFFLLKRRHIDPFVTIEVELQWQWKLTDVKINSSIGPGDEMIVPGDLEGTYNTVSSIFTVAGKIYRSTWDYWCWITVTVKVKHMLRLIVK